MIAHELIHVVQQNGAAVQRSYQPLETSREQPATVVSQAIGHLARGSVVQLWPLYEVNKKPRMGWKCHDAVFYWMLRDIRMSAKKANKMLNRIYEKGEYASSFQWIGNGLGYANGVRITNQTIGNIQVGDILFTGSPKNPVHSMVCDGPGTIQGYNNGGTFGGSVDQYEQNINLNQSRSVQFPAMWDNTGTKFGIYGEYLYRVPYATAKETVKKYINYFEE